MLGSGRPLPQEDGSAAAGYRPTGKKPGSQAHPGHKAEALAQILRDQAQLPDRKFQKNDSRSQSNIITRGSEAIWPWCGKQSRREPHRRRRAQQASTYSPGRAECTQASHGRRGDTPWTKSGRGPRPPLAKGRAASEMEQELSTPKQASGQQGQQAGRTHVTTRRTRCSVTSVASQGFVFHATHRAF